MSFGTFIKTAALPSVLILIFAWTAMAEEPATGNTTEPVAGSTAAPAAGPTAGDELVVPVEGVYTRRPGPRVDDLSDPITRTREDFNRGNQNLIEILEGVPGVAVKELGGADGPWRVMIRGGGEKGAAVYLDGVLLNDPAGVVPDLSRIPMGLVDSVVVYRGSAPVGYPETGTSGVVDIRTMPTSNVRRGQVRLAYDSQETVEACLGVAGDVLGNSLMFGARSEWGPGLYDYTDTRGTAKISGDDRGRVRTNNNFADHDVIIKGERKVAGYRIYAAGYYNYYERELPGLDYQRASESRITGDRILAYVGVKRPAALGSDLDAEVRLSGVWERYHLEDPDGELGPVRDDTGERTRLGTDFFLNYYGLRYNEIALYLGFYNDAYQPASDTDKELDRVSAKRNSIYLNASDELNFWDRRVKVKPRLRYVLENNTYEGPTLARQQGVSASSTSFSTTNADVSLDVLLAKNLWFTAAAGQFYRAPDFLEEAGDRISLVGNPELSPERSDMWEAGLKYDMGPVMEIDVLQAEVSVFQVNYSDRIGWMDMGGGQWMAENVGDARVTGVEAGMHLNLRDRLLVEAAYTWQEARDLSDQSDLFGNNLPNLAANTATVSATLYQQYGRIYYKGYYQDVRWLDEANTISAPPRFIHSLGIGYYRGKWTVGLEAINLTNDRSREVLGYPLPGTRYQVLMEYQE